MRRLLPLVGAFALAFYGCSGGTATNDDAGLDGATDATTDAASDAGTDAVQCHPTGVDTPDYTGSDNGFVDADCDGIDGTIANAIFVDGLTGTDASPGTMASPKQTIAAAIAAASAATPKKDVYISKGTYAEHVDMADGVSLYGGYDAAKSWSRKIANVTNIASPTSVGISVVSPTSALTIQLLTVTTHDAPSGNGGSAQGIRIVDASAGVKVQGCTVISGNGGSGVVPEPAPGAPGGNASAADGGASPCGSSGGTGGAAVNGISAGNAGGPGGGAAGGDGGTAGSAGAGCCIAGTGSAGGGGTKGGAGANGTDSSIAAPSIGTLLGDGSYVTADGTPGTAGTNGSGGGGGGSGGGDISGCPYTCGNDTSGYGGGGGAGGCGGGAGGAGGGGGASFGIVVVASTVTVDQCQINAGKGGDGAPGAAGGTGGSAGTGVGGGPAGGSAGGGGPGADGAAGGNGGAGSGGTGGPSICVAYFGTAPTYTSTQCTRAGGGAAGASGGGVAPKGLAGIDADVRGL